MTATERVDYALVLNAIRPASEWTLVGFDYDGLVWLDATAKPSRAELDAAWPAVQANRAWAAVRAERDRLLVGSDWTQMPDSPLDAAGQQTWAIYRQALRDIPQDFDSPESVVWPEQP